MLAVTLGATLGALSFPMQAQLRVAPPERKTPRALGVMETYKNGSHRLVPVTFFYEKKYYDATFYHATPVPFTLYSETVYEVQQFGKPLGTFTVQSATRNEAAWFGNGKFKGIPDPLMVAKKKVKAVVVEDPSKPVLHRREGSEGDIPAVHPSASASATETDDDPDRPKLHRREGGGGDAAAVGAQAGQAQAGTPSTQTTASSANPSTASGVNPSSSPSSTTGGAGQTEESSGQDPNRPKLQHKDSGKGGAGSTESPSASTTSSPSTTASTTARSATTTVASTKGMAAPPVEAAERTLSDDPDHPVLRRGKPVEAQGGRDLPEFKLEEAVSRQVAVSDAGTSRDAEQLIYVCREEERNKLESEAREMAVAELRRLGAQRGLVLPEAKTAGKSKATATKSAAKSNGQTAELKPTEEQFVPYDLEYNNYATVVYSARYMAPAGAQARSWVVTVLAREEEDFKLVKLYSAVSDPRELGLYPEVRLVDAVDPEGYGHFGLLFREKKRDGVSWLLGRLTGYELQTIFETPAR